TPATAARRHCTRSGQWSLDAHTLCSARNLARPQVPAGADARDVGRQARRLLPSPPRDDDVSISADNGARARAPLLCPAAAHGGVCMSRGDVDTCALRAQAAEQAIGRAVFGGELGRRAFFKAVGATTATAALASVFPMAAAKAIAQDKPGPPEKRDLKIGFIPITCATPIIMAEPMGFYKKQGLNVQVLKASSWAMIRDISINGETDATHMLSPMPLAITLGVGSQSVPYVMPAVENINGQAITLATKHKGIKSAADMKGFKFGVPFDYSMPNFLLPY